MRTHQHFALRVSNYNQVKRELIKRYPSTKKEFDKEQRKYEGEFGK